MGDCRVRSGARPNRQAGGDVVLLPVDGSEAKPLIPVESNAWGARFSPSGTLLAYGSNEAGQCQLWVAQFDAATATLGKRKLAPTDKYLSYHFWARDGGQLLYLDRTQRLMAVEVKLEPEFVLEQPKLVLDLSTARMVPGGLPLDGGADGTSFAFLQRGPEEQTCHHLHVVFDWFEQLKAKAPEAAQ